MKPCEYGVRMKKTVSVLKLKRSLGKSFIHLQAGNHFLFLSGYTKSFTGGHYFTNSHLQRTGEVMAFSLTLIFQPPKSFRRL